MTPTRKLQRVARSVTIAAYDKELANVRGDLRVLKWMTGAVFALVGAVIATTAPGLWLLLRVAAKVGALG